MRYFVLAIMPISLLAGCNSPQGANWASADFNKYDKRYDQFPTQLLRVGLLREEVERIVGPSLIPSSADAYSETFIVEKWVSVPGPDYVDERLHLRFKDGKLAEWKIENPTSITLVPNG